MTTMTSTLPTQGGSSRWLLIVSLALNLFFIGAASTLAARHYLESGQPEAVQFQRTAAGRIEWLAAPLPREDAEKLRASFRPQATAAEQARGALNRAIDHLQAALRKQPFDPADLRAALIEIRTSRPVYEQVMGDLYFAAVVEMSTEARLKLADLVRPRPATKR
jgi:uncharacterized membrane protein